MNDFDKQVQLKVEQELQKILNNPRAVIEAYQKELDKATGIIKEMKPKSDFYDMVTQSQTEIDMKEVAKILNFKNMGRNKLFLYLRDRGVLDSGNEPYQLYVDKGFFRVVEMKINLPHSDNIISTKTVVYQKGLDYIRKILLKDGYEYNDR